MAAPGCGGEAVLTATTKDVQASDLRRLLLTGRRQWFGANK